MKKGKYDWLLEQYPKFMNKEDLYRVCHVSKRTALFYLEGGLIPYVDSEKKTRKYTIRTVDVIEFLERRDKSPFPVAPPSGWYAEKKKKSSDPRYYSRGERLRIGEALNRILGSYPDVLSTKQVGGILGHRHDTIAGWCTKGKIEYLNMGNSFLIPKISLVEYIMADNCRHLSPSEKDYILRMSREINQTHKKTINI